MKDERNLKILEPAALIATVSVISFIALAICGYSFVKHLLTPLSGMNDDEAIWKLITEGVDMLILIVSVIFMILAMVQVKKFGTPFIAEVITALNTAAFVVMTGGMVHMLLVAVYPMVIAINTFNVADYGDYSFGCGAMLFGGFLMASTELVKYGVRTVTPTQRSHTKEEQPSEKTGDEPVKQEKSVLPKQSGEPEEYQE